MDEKSFVHSMNSSILMKEKLPAVAILVEQFLSIPNKKGETVPFILNSAQRKLVLNKCGRDLVPKARQEGVSSYEVAETVVCAMTEQNFNGVIVSHDTKATQKLLKKAHFYLDNLRGIPRPIISHANKNEIIFPETNSSISIGTAGNDDFGVGDTIHKLHCSEIALWKNGPKIMKGLFQSVPKLSDGGRISIESTGRGMGTHYHKLVMANLEADSLYNVIFLDWQSFDEYKYLLSEEEERRVLDNLQDEYEEPNVRNKFKLSAGQIAWRRDKIKSEFLGDVNAFKEEYPMTLEEAFQPTGYGVFSKFNYEDSKRWETINATEWRLEGHPKRDFNYVIGVDVGAGIKKDNSVVEVFCLETNEQVGEYINNRIDPNDLGMVVVRIGMEYNECLLVIESNNYGMTTINYVRKEYNSSKLYSREGNKSDDFGELANLGCLTTARTKPLLIGQLRILFNDNFKIYSKLLLSELSTFVETEGGKLEADTGCKDDCVMASAMATQGMFNIHKFMYIEDVKKEDNMSLFSIGAIKHELARNYGEDTISGKLSSYLGNGREYYN